MTPLLVGLTGGLASGKSTVAKLLARAGCEVVDADEVVAALYTPGAAGAQAIREIAGARVLGPEGGVDRPALARRLFHDRALRAEIEAAIHPLVRRQFTAVAAASDADFVVLEATLLVEADYRPDFDLVVTIEADSQTQFARAVARGLTAEQARARLLVQGDGAERLAAADIIIHNDGTLGDLERSVARLMDTLEERLATQRETEAEAET